MKSSYEQLEPTKVKLTVEVANDEFKPKVDDAAKRVAEQVQIPGFRRGHVPARVLEAKIGFGAIVNEAMENSIDGYYQDALKANELHPLGQPAVEVTSIPDSAESKDPFGFNVTVNVRPEISIPDPAGLTVEVDAIKVSDEDVEAALNELRGRFGSFNTVDRAAKDGDSVTIDLSAKIDGEEVDSAAGVSYTIGSKSMLEGMDEQLIGKKAGESVEYTTKLIGGDHAGEEADVEITVENVREADLPEADDDFAQMASEFDTIEELRADLRKQVENDAEQAQVVAARDSLLEQLTEAVEIPLSDEIIDAQVADHLQSEGLAADDAHGAEIRDDLAESLRGQLLLDVLAEKFQVQVGQDELFSFLVQQAQAYQMDPNKFLQAAAQTGQIPAFSAELARGKSLIAALRLATVKDSEGKEIDVESVVGPRAEGEVEHPDFSASAAKPAAKPAAKKAEAPKAEAADSSSEAGAFDPADHKVNEVVEYAEGADAAEVARVLEAEKAGKARKTVIEKLEKLEK